MLSEDEAEILRLDSAWNEAYLRRDRAPLADILADDFTGLTAAGQPITKAILMINPGGVVLSRLAPLALPEARARGTIARALPLRISDSRH